MLFKTKLTNEAKVLQALKKAGRYGLWGDELVKVGTHRFSEYVRSLRADGHNIDCVRINGTTRRKYYLNDERAFEND